MKIIKEFPAHEPIVAMVTYKDTVIVATTKSAYRLVADKMVQMEFVKLEDTNGNSAPVVEDIPF